jgi:carboxypeptidase T
MTHRQYSTTVFPPNRAAITAISDKIQYFTNYANSIGYTAAGTTVDYAFKELGAASVTFELGTAFYQDCATFENTIWPLNQQPLMFLAKISRLPYTMGQAPDITSLSASVSAGDLTITATASDSAWSKNNVSTSQQAVTEIRAWVDAHPYSSNPGTGTVLTNGSVNVNISGLTTGRHTVYTQATDSAGKRGPVTAIYFNK